MHIELVVIAVLAVVAVVAVVRIVRANSIERSISGHRRQLSSIEGVVHRTRERGVAADVRAPSAPGPVSQPVPSEPPEARIDPGSEPAQRVSEEGRLVFGDLSLTPVKPPVPPVYVPRAARRRAGRDARRARSGRPRLVVAVPVVLVVAAAGGAYAMFAVRSHGVGPGPATTGPPATARHVTGAVRVGSRTARVHHRSATRPPSSLTVVASTATSATVTAPAGTYRIVISASAPCWVGFEERVGQAGPWLADATIGANGVATTSFKATGSLIVVIGAPKSVTSIEVNGLPLHLAQLPSQSYDLHFIRGSN